MARDGKILVIGAAGQVGTDLVPALRRDYGAANVVATVHRKPGSPSLADGPVEPLDVTDKAALLRLVERHGIDRIYHLPALMSAAGEADPETAWRLNMVALKDVLDLAVERRLRQVFFPSSIAVFGPTTPQQRTPQRTVLEPTTIYGVTKLAGENLCNYYFHRHKLDVRGLRYPGLVSYKNFSGGGTTDYSVEMFLSAKSDGRYRCFVRPDTRLPLLYMDDAIEATVQLMQADASRLTVRTSYNLGGLDFTAGELAEAVATRVPGFTCEFVPDHRQAIADSWPDSIDDSDARRDWDWQPTYELPQLVDAMLRGVGLRSLSEK